jgi:phosphoglycerate dehydrogenase-like enzyme
MENVVCRPHIGSVSREERGVRFSDIFDQINSCPDGTPINV